MTRLLKEHRTLAVATVVDTQGSAPRDLDAKMIVLPTGETRGTVGGGALEKKVTEDALEAMSSGKGLFRTYDLKEEEKGGIGPICGGSVSVHVEVLRAPDRLLVLGGGHIGKALVEMAKVLEMEVVVVDEREEYASEERFPGADLLIRALPSDPDLRLRVTDSTYVVIITHGHVHDKAALKNLLDTGAAYVGMIGSKKKVRTVMRELEDEGVPAERLATVHSPIGLDIGAETPAEIALSILSEITSIKRKGGNSPLSLKLKWMEG